MGICAKGFANPICRNECLWGFQGQYNPEPTAVSFSALNNSDGGGGGRWVILFFVVV